MITPKTTFIVGGGASEPYELPIASSICRDARGLQPLSVIYQLVSAALDGHTRLLDEMLEDFREHPTSSIDAYLEYRQQEPDTMRVGKLLIAALMGQALAVRNNLTTQAYEGDWIRHVISHMSRGAARAAGFAKAAQKVEFVTFNFDSLIEERSAQLLRSIYKRHDGIEEATRSIHVTHVHGQIPDPPPPPMQIPIRSGGATVNQATDPKWVEWLKKAAPEIRVVMDDIDDALLRKVKDTIDASKIVCFLGFSYDKGNLAKLGFPKQQKRSIEVFGSAFDLTKEQRSHAQARIGPLTPLSLADSDEKCLNVLQNRHILRD